MKNIDADDMDIGSKSICDGCVKKFKVDKKPSFSILNDLYVPPVPPEIGNLNTYEKILIQRAKAFQTIQKKGTVMKKKLPNHVKIDSLKGSTIHSPLPVEETLEKEYVLIQIYLIQIMKYISQFVVTLLKIKKYLKIMWI